MSPQRWRDMEAIYDAAVDLPPAERDRYLDEQCGPDTDLRREVAGMFADAAGFTGVVESAAAAATDDDADPWVGRRLGPYRVLRLIGHGGMGAVYECLREEGFEKRVAVKLVKYTFDSDLARRRFQQERQILARLDHANIARLLDGGDYQGRVPYLVMEFVEGRPLLDACAGLPIAARLRLFQKILAAVSYAHAELVVHRDIKPANILVTRDGEPKLLDFGIARLTGQEASGTLTMSAVMTPDYASPEQVKAEPAGVATDIYSLGATLYEILSGARPHGLETYSTAEIYRAICENEVRPPSQRAADPALGRQLRGDLDTLVLHAMAREPAKRYPSADAFRAEIDRFLEARPLTVRPASTTERAWKFVRRNRLSVAAAIVVAASLIAGTTVSAIEARRAQRRFAQVRELANTFLFQLYDQVTPLPGSTAVRASIVETARKYLDGLAREAGGDQGLLVELADAYERLGTVEGQIGSANLGKVEDARVSFRHALDLYARLGVGPRSPLQLRRKAAMVWWLLARLEFAGYHDADAGADALRARDLLQGTLSDPAARRVRASAESTIGEIRVREGKPAEALGLFESVQRALLDLRASGFQDPGLAEDMEAVSQRIARARVSLADLDGASAVYDELLRNSPPCDEQGPLGRECRTVAVHLTWAADVYAATDRPNLGDPAKGSRLYEKALHITERFVAQDPEDRQARYELAVRYGKLGDSVWESNPTRALALYEQALATALPLVSKEQLEILRSSYLTAVCRPLVKLGRIAEARHGFEEAFRIDGRTDSRSPYADRVNELSARLIDPSLLAAEGRSADAVQVLHEIIRDAQGMHAERPSDFSPVFMVCQAYRLLASFGGRQERRDAYLKSAAAWHSWPATSFTRREEQKDLDAAR